LQAALQSANEFRVSKMKPLSHLASVPDECSVRWHNLFMAIRVLVVEDDPVTARLISESLRDQGWSSTVEGDGERGLRLAQLGGFDALVLDIMLPNRDGLSVVRQLRQAGNNVPVLVLSARGDLEQRVAGLEAGADDYLPKPYAQSELVARLRSITRRPAPGNSEYLTVADLRYRTDTYAVQRGEQRVTLSPREGRLLECLMRAGGAVVSRRDIISAVWSYDFDPGTNLVEVYIRRLRLQLEPAGTRPLIHTVRGLGYMLRELA
jgi:DNA-binding response OmpR family regulator